VTIRVLHIIESFGYTGAGRQTALLAAGLPRDEFDVHVCAIGPLGPLHDELVGATIPAQAFARRLPFDPVALWRLHRHITALRPSVVHTWEFAANSYGRLVCGKGHLVATERRTELWKRWPEEHLDRWLQPRAQRLLATSNAVRDFCLLRRGLPQPGRIEVVPPGVAIEDSRSGDVTPKGELIRFPGVWQASLREELALGEEAKLVVAVGSLRHSRRVKDMIWALELLGSVIPQLHLLLVGDGPQRRSLERYAAEFRHAGRIHFLGSRDAREVWPQVDLFWSASEEDGPPLALLEAMAAGVPVVASDTPGNREVITAGQTGLLFPLGDRPSLARCTLRLVQDAAMATRISQEAQGYMQREFVPNGLIHRHAELYRELAA
jgi:glycosyltransferase involved in cell wall biosynthesis